ncbi:hypothetical protein [Rhodococcoides fascians]|uniref:hypothetical protein n=1 Tax=Rhodococcoides fascians TaxID=1828 RepID=UPI00056CB5A0|nr:hypothetical protein [Rhodococcus fascians]
MTEQLLTVDGRTVTNMERLGWIDGASRWVLELEDGTSILATSTEITVYVRKSTEPVARPKGLSLGAMCAIGGAAFVAVLALGIAWMTRVGLL